MDARLTRIEEALVAAHNALALVSGLVTDYVDSLDAFQNKARSGDTVTGPEVERCCGAPDLTPMMGGTSVCGNCGATVKSEPEA